MGKNVVRLSRKNLDTKRRVKTSSGRTHFSKINNTSSLSNSIKFSTDSKGLSFEMNDYGLNVDEGRKAGRYAPVNKIMEWVRTKGIRPRDPQGKFLRVTDKSMKSLSFMLNRAIFKNGIEPTGFFSKPFESELDKLERKIPDTLIQDIDIFFNR